MSGPVTYSLVPFASTVTVGDANNAQGVEGAPTIIASSVALAKQFGCDDLADGTPEGQARAKEYIKRQVADGVFRQEDIDRGNATEATQTDTSPLVDRSLAPADCSSFHQGFSMDTVIGNGITLKNFVFDYPQIPHHKYRSIPAQAGLAAADIVCNLSQLCKNAWEPIKAQYPNIMMTNALRTGSAIGQGQHGTGQAMDIQFTGITNSQYFSIAQWIKANITFDQLLLEYSTERGPLTTWLHVSVYAGTGIQTKPINKVLTLFNHQMKNVGLVSYA